jgi:polyhydroxyalkanoate synthase subunit PhaE
LTNDFRTLMDQWLEQQQAWWAQLSATDPSAQKVWDPLFSATANPQSAEPQQRILAQLAGQLLVLNQHAEPLFKALQAPDAGAALADVVQQWLQMLQRQAGEDATAPWSLPQALVTLLHATGLDESQLLDGAALETLSRLFATPDTTPEQARAQAREAMQLLLEYQQALQHYLGQIHAVSQQAARELLETLHRSDTPATSLGALHDLWVDHYERAYRQRAFSDAFQAAHGRISNAHMRLQRFAQRLRDAHLQTAGLASHQQLQQLRRDTHLLRKQVRQLQQAQTPDTETTIAALRAELDALRNEIRPAVPTPGRKRKA